MTSTWAAKAGRRLAIVDFDPAGAELSLPTQLDALASYLHTHRAELLRLRDSSPDLEVRVSWTPRYPQECLVVPAQLIRSLAELELDIMLDSYPS